MVQLARCRIQSGVMLLGKEGKEGEGVEEKEEQVKKEHRELSVEADKT